jgi:hypothetical protein
VLQRGDVEHGYRNGRGEASRRCDAPDQPRIRTATPPELLPVDAGTSAEPPPFVDCPVLIVGDSVEVVDDGVPDAGSLDVTGSVVTDVGSLEDELVVEGSVTGTAPVDPVVVTGVVVVVGSVLVDPGVDVVVGSVVDVWFGKPV